MRVSYEESLANYLGIQRRGDGGEHVVLSVRVEVNAGQVLSSEITPSVCRSCPDMEKATSLLPQWQGNNGRGGLCDPVHSWKFQSLEPGGPIGFHLNSRHISRSWNDQKTPQSVTLI